MTPTTLRLSCDADLVGAVPHLFGFVPEESLSLLTVPMPPGPPGVGPAARLELTEAGGPGGQPYVAGVISRFARDRFGIYAAVVHTDLPLRDACESPVVLTAVRRVRELDDPRVGAWVVARDGWQRLPGHAPFEDRSGPRPLDELGHARAVTELVLTGSAPVAGRADLGIAREPDSATGSLLLDALADRMQRRLPGVVLTVRAYDELVTRRLRPDQGLSGRDRELLARLLLGLERPGVRDAVLTRVLVGTGMPVELLTEPELVGQLWTGGPIEAADRRRPLEVLARFAPSGVVAPTSALLALLAWRRGEGARAAVLAELALEDRPEYSLARLVLEVQASGAIPPAARQDALEDDADDWFGPSPFLDEPGGHPDLDDLSDIEEDGPDGSWWLGGPPTDDRCLQMYTEELIDEIERGDGRSGTT
ncbi:DUF4192 family protein [Georgenia sp. Z1344]|uniref:DUF4192 family protein n=1 Tax=Georgenia sp. Z1344 TaxID=3416706 RepID=UPI003CEA14B0